MATDTGTKHHQIFRRSLQQCIRTDHNRANSRVLHVQARRHVRRGAASSQGQLPPYGTNKHKKTCKSMSSEKQVKFAQMLHSLAARRHLCGWLWGGHFGSSEVAGANRDTQRTRLAWRPGAKAAGAKAAAEAIDKSRTTLDLNILLSTAMHHQQSATFFCPVALNRRGVQAGTRALVRHTLAQSAITWRGRSTFISAAEGKKNAGTAAKKKGETARKYTRKHHHAHSL